jgi:hypothetical protein
LTDPSPSRAVTAVDLRRRDKPSLRRWLGIAAAGAVLAAAVVLLILRPWSPTPDRKASADDTTKDGKTKDEDSAPDARKLLPPPRRDDFRLKVEWVGFTPDEDGIVRVPHGTTASFRIDVAEDAYVGLWTVDTKGEILQLFPNGTDKDHFFKAGQPRTIPSKERAIRAGVLSNGVEVVRVIASSAPWTPSDLSENAGDFRRFASGTSEETEAMTIRGLVVDPAGRNGTRGAEIELPYRVVPRR